MRLIKIDDNDSEQRLDRFLCKLFKNSSRTLIYKLNRKNIIKVKSENELKYRKEKFDYRLKKWDEIKLFIDENEFLELTKSINENKNTINNKKLDKKDIIFEDEYLLIVNKPAWIDVHPWDFKTKDLSLIDLVNDYLWDKYNSLTFKPSLIHRIDRDTSWIILIAKKKDILTKLVSDLKNKNKIEKTYLALVIWKLKNKSWTINKKLLRIENAKRENKVRVSDNWKEAITHYKVIWEYKLETKNKTEDISLLEINIETWRMHQIRVHLSHIWNPVLWDNKYWYKPLNIYLCKNHWLCRQALHSSKLKFYHYWINKEKTVEADLKEDMKSFIKMLKKLW